MLMLHESAEDESLLLTILSSLSVVSSMLFVVCFYLLLKRMSLSRIDEEMRRRAKEMMEECSL